MSLMTEEEKSYLYQISELCNSIKASPNDTCTNYGNILFYTIRKLVHELYQKQLRNEVSDINLTLEDLKKILSERVDMCAYEFMNMYKIKNS